MKTTSLPACLSAIFTATLMHCALAQGQTYTLPEEWAGGAVGEKTDNPLVVAGEPMWKAVSIWPGSLTESDNYKEMVWGGKNWLSAHPDEQSHGGQPSIEPGEYTVDIASRAAWAASPGSKLGALIFIAPKTGTYKVKGSYKLYTWEGNQANVDISVRVINQGATEEVKQLETGEAKVWMPMAFEVPLKEGQELAFLMSFRGMHIAAALSLRELELTLAGAQP